MAKNNNRYNKKPNYHPRHRSNSSIHFSISSPPYSPAPFRNPIPFESFPMLPSPSFNPPIDDKENIHLQPFSSSNLLPPSFDFLLEKLNSTINSISSKVNSIFGELKSLRELGNLLKNLKENNGVRTSCKSPSFGNSDILSNEDRTEANSGPMSLQNNGESLLEQNQRERKELERKQNEEIKRQAEIRNPKVILIKDEEFSGKKNSFKVDKKDQKNQMDQKNKIEKREQRERKWKEKKRAEKARRKEKKRNKDKRKEKFEFLNKKEKKHKIMIKE